ncbi:MAG TPA: hypothetical protein VFX18_01225 [Candidatus Nitrosocosmicus sp.]|nr:hypothetical protein [Candidatus Nitrosocosmicus sp.]
MKNLQTILIAALIFSTSLLFLFAINNAQAAPPRFLVHHISFGPLLGVMQNPNGTVNWLIFGTWKSSLSNTATVQNASVFDAAIEMIKPDGTGHHTHALSNFTVQSVSHPNTNTTMFTGSSTINMREGPILNVPTTILLSNNNVISIFFDPKSVQNHFGDSPFYGVILNNRGPIAGTMGQSMGGPMHR